MTPHRILTRGISILGALALVGCGDDGGDGNGTDEPTTFRVRVENVASFSHLKSGGFATALDADAPGPLAPGQAYEFSFTAAPGHRLAFATMFGQSNDWFFAPTGGSIALYQDDTPISGDITDQISLYDAGTEVDEEPAVGPHVAPNQSSSTDGPGAPDSNPSVRAVPDPVTLTDGDEFDRPAVEEMIAVTVTSDPATREFTVRIENVSEDGVTLQTSEGGKVVRVSPGVWIVGADEHLLFAPGEPDRGQGLEGIAEDGDNARLSASLEPFAGVATPISPGVYVLHVDGNPLFTPGAAEPGQGLEAIAERGDPAELAAAYTAELPPAASAFGVFDTPALATEPGPIRPGGAYELELEAMPGDRLSLATMYGASNDWIFATGADGIALFGQDGDPRTGDVTDQISIWDVGTEHSEEPGVGPHIGGPEGEDDATGTVRLVPGSEYAVPATAHIKVTIALP